MERNGEKKRRKLTARNAEHARLPYFFFFKEKYDASDIREGKHQVYLLHRLYRYDGILSLPVKNSKSTRADKLECVDRSRMRGDYGGKIIIDLDMEVRILDSRCSEISTNQFGHWHFAEQIGTTTPSS